MSRRQELLELAIELGALQFGEFRLSSGGTSPYYFDGRLFTLNHWGGRLVALELLPFVRARKVRSVGGLTMGADPIAVNIASLSNNDGAGCGIDAFVVRKEAKRHGSRRRIENPPAQGIKVAVVDDVCTSGASLFEAIYAVEQLGCKAVLVAVVLDRKEGGSEKIKKKGYNFVSLLEATPEGEIVPSV